MLAQLITQWAKEKKEDEQSSSTMCGEKAAVLSTSSSSSSSSSSLLTSSAIGIVENSFEENLQRAPTKETSASITLPPKGRPLSSQRRKRDRDSANENSPHLGEGLTMSHARVSSTVPYAQPPFMVTIPSAGFLLQAQKWWRPCGSSLDTSLPNSSTKSKLPDFLRSPSTPAAVGRGGIHLPVSSHPIFHGEVLGFYKNAESGKGSGSGGSIPKKVRQMLDSMLQYIRSPQVLGAVDELPAGARLFIALQQPAPPSDRIVVAGVSPSKPIPKLSTRRCPEPRATTSAAVPPPLQVVGCVVAVELEKAQRHSGIDIPLTDQIRSNLSTQEDLSTSLLPPSVAEVTSQDGDKNDEQTWNKNKNYKKKDIPDGREELPRFLEGGIGSQQELSNSLHAYHTWIREDSTISDVQVQGGCIAGVQLVWVDTSARRQNIATSLCDAVRHHLVYGLECTRDQVAFSQPTRDGKVFALGYTGRSDFLTFW